VLTQKTQRGSNVRLGGRERRAVKKLLKTLKIRTVPGGGGDIGGSWFGTLRVRTRPQHVNHGWRTE